MSSQSLLGLPPIPTTLKSIIPFIQRANELRDQDPVMAYWCAYHAAQLGISLKAKDETSRDVLASLLSYLERLKKEIGPSDAVGIENVGAAYVENFALKVFTQADNEDRSGSATRSTAKKFLAAAHFFEVLRIFSKAESEEKIKYAKWKAADIAKAFREGRKPTPGPAVSEAPETHLTASPPPRSDAPIYDHVPSIAVEPVSPSTPHRFTGAHLDVGLSQNRLDARDEATPSTWSTAATPGTAPVWEGRPSPVNETTRTPWVSEGLEGREEFTQDATNLVPDLDSEASVTDLPEPPPQPYVDQPTRLPSIPSTSPTSYQNVVASLPSPAPQSSSFLPPGAPIRLPEESTPRFVPSELGAAPAFELTPSIIAKAQKHCRFAISSLDYEDLEQARKELRTALALLGA
ncbi:hypothetical protein H0H93_004949 [Arthromyces matolae]|nr:hypothetical protein H0H93_004949 [Arthromyces matolae]